MIINKEVGYFVGIVKSTHASIPGSFKDEIVDLKWVSYTEGLETITYKGGRDILMRARDFLNN